MEHINARITTYHGDYADARALFEDSLDLLTDAPSIYEQGDDQTRRLCNQAFFTKVYIDEDNTIHADLQHPFTILLDPKVHKHAHEYAKTPAAPTIPDRALP